MGILIPQVVTTIDGKEHTTDPVSYDLIKNRTVYVLGEVNAESAFSIISQLRYLDSKSNKDIQLLICSRGGDVDSGLAILDTMSALRSPVNTVGIGQVCSMAAVLLSAGTYGKRGVTPNTEVMIHQPLGGVQGQSTDISLAAAHIESVKAKLATILAKNCGKDLTEITKMLERDYWMSAQMAKEFGIVDYVGFPELI